MGTPQEDARIEAMFKAGVITEDVKFLLQGKDPKKAKEHEFKAQLDELFRPIEEALEKAKRGHG